MVSSVEPLLVREQAVLGRCGSFVSQKLPPCARKVRPVMPALQKEALELTGQGDWNAAMVKGRIGVG